jgi:hypothetical protein
MDNNFNDKLISLLPLYEKVRASMIMLENFDEKRQVYIAPINQIRNALDHVFNAVRYSNEPETCNYELKEVKEHLGRAGYDSLDLLASSLGVAIITKLESYELDVIVTVFPDYYTKIKPKITELQTYIAESRSKRNLSCEKYFSDYLDNIKQLKEINKEIDMRIPSLVEFRDKREREKHDQQRGEQKKKKNERLWQYLIGPIIGFVSAVIIMLLTWFLTK